MSDNKNWWWVLVVIPFPLWGWVSARLGDKFARLSHPSMYQHEAAMRAAKYVTVGVVTVAGVIVGVLLIYNS
jgi:hypothetical protein